jgi:hypothetical protein
MSSPTRPSTFGYAEAGGVAVICFEWLQRPENVVASYVRWTDCRGVDAPHAIRIEHHKTGEVVLHPEEIDAAEIVPFYADAEAILAQVSRRGVSMILKRLRDGITKPSTPDTMSKVVCKVRAAARLVHPRCLPARRHDQTGASRTDRWPGVRLSAQPVEGL